MVRPELAIVIPSLNEAATIEKVVASVKPFGLPIVVSDGSTDDTAAVARAAGAHVVELGINRGYDGALNAGFAAAADLDAEFVLTMDADGQHPEHLIPIFLDLLRHSADVVVGRRDRLQRTGERFFAWLGRTIFDIEDPLCGMKAYRMAVYSSLGHFDSQKSIGTELALFAVRSGYRVRQIDVPTRDRLDQPRFGRVLRANFRIFCAAVLAAANASIHGRPPLFPSTRRNNVLSYGDRNDFFLFAPRDAEDALSTVDEFKAALKKAPSCISFCEFDIPVRDDEPKFQSYHSLFSRLEMEEFKAFSYDELRKSATIAAAPAARATLLHFHILAVTLSKASAIEKLVDSGAGPTVVAGPSEVVDLVLAREQARRLSGTPTFPAKLVGHPPTTTLTRALVIVPARAMVILSATVTATCRVIWEYPTRILTTTARAIRAYPTRILTATARAIRAYPRRVMTKTARVIRAYPMGNLMTTARAVRASYVAILMTTVTATYRVMWAYYHVKRTYSVARTTLKGEWAVVRLFYTCRHALGKRVVVMVVEDSGTRVNLDPALKIAAGLTSRGVVPLVLSSSAAVSKEFAQLRGALSVNLASLNWHMEHIRSAASILCKGGEPDDASDTSAPIDSLLSPVEEISRRFEFLTPLLRIQAVLTVYETLPLCIAVGFWAREAGYPWIGFFPILVGDRPDGHLFCADYQLVYGEQLADMIVSDGVAAANVHVVGSPTYDRFHGLDRAVERVNLLGQFPKAQGKLLICVATEAFPEPLVELDPILRTLSNDDRYHIVLKLHPEDSLEFFNRFVATLPGQERIDVVKTFPLEPLLAGCDLLICIVSNIAISASVIGTPVLICDFSKKSSAIDFVAEGLCFGCNNPEQLAASVENIIGNSDFRAAAQEKVSRHIARFNGPNDGRSSERIADFALLAAKKGAVTPQRLFYPTSPSAVTSTPQFSPQGGGEG